MFVVELIATEIMKKFVILLSFICFLKIEGRTYLNADGITNTYQLINRVFGGGSSAIEMPDCNHTSFGPHVTQEWDSTLNRYVFAFHLHIKDDDDRCSRFDRQRSEIKTNDFEDLTGHDGDSVTVSWNFKLDGGFMAPYSFCHIHQLKAVGGDDSMPIITLTPRKSSPNELQLLQYDSKGALIFLETVPLQPFLGIWVHAVSNVTYGHNGRYSIEISRLSDNAVLLSYSSNDIDFWRNETTFIRPKWGIYRSIHESVLSRDETVLFDNFCVGKGETDLCI